MRHALHVMMFVLVALVATSSLAGCGSTIYQPSRMAQWSGPSAEAQINDADIRAAFEARPQLASDLSVALYSFDPSKAGELSEVLRELDEVSEVYRIPDLLVDGARRYSRREPWQPSRPVSLKQLRLLAARAQCDVLLVFDYGYHITQDANAWVAAAPLVVPLFAAPWLDLVAESYLDVYAIDTRNGYLYGQLDNSHEDREDHITIYSAGRGQEMVDAQWSTLRAAAVESLVGLIHEERRTAVRGDVL